MRPLATLTLAAALGLTAPITAQPVSTGAAAQAEARTGPKIQLEPASVEFGQIDDSQIVEQVVKLTNIGDEILRIPEQEGVKTSCGCTVPALEKYVLEPGETVEMTVRFDARNRQGHQSKNVTIRGEGSDAPIVLAVNSFVVQRVQVVEGLANLGTVDQGDTASVQISVRGMAPDFEVTEVIASRDDMFQVEILGTEVVQREDPITGEMIEVGETKIEVSLMPDAPIGRTDGKLTIRTNDEIAAQKETRTLVVVKGDVRIDPAVVRLGALEPGGVFEQSITVFSNKDRSFNIERVLFVTSDLSEADKALITTSHEPISTEDGRVGHVVTFAGEVSDTMRIVRGKLVIVTDAPGQRVISANVAGVVRQP